MAAVLYLHSPHGVPAEYAVPRMAVVGEVHLLSVDDSVARGDQEWLAACASVDYIQGAPRGDELVDRVVARARAVSAEAVVSHSEYFVLAASAAAVRLGLPEAGSGVAKARDKGLMRETWAAAGLPVPWFARVRTADEAVAALQRIGGPVLLKPAFGAGSVGQAVVVEPREMDLTWRRLSTTLAVLEQHGYTDPMVEHSSSNFVVEEVVDGDAQRWYGDAMGLADYVSVEGFVAGGSYHPIAVVGRFPTIGHFTEMGSVAPCPLPPDRLEEVIALARRAVDALGLENCGTHTEIKLGVEGPVLIESAARLAGSAITEVVEHVHGVDLVGVVTEVLTGQHSTGQHSTETTPIGQAPDGRAAAELSLIGASSTGSAWPAPLPWAARALVDDRLGLTATRLRSVSGLTVDEGEAIQRFDPTLGIANCSGMVFATATDVGDLVRDARSFFDNLEDVLSSLGKDRS